jgi:hypothetical protein
MSRKPNRRKDDADMPIEETVMHLFMLHMLQYDAWCHPERGAVSPTLSAFFASCDPKELAMLHWARWLRVEHESDEGVDLLTAPAALTLVENMIKQSELPADLAAEMRLAVQDPRDWDNPLWRQQNRN